MIKSDILRVCRGQVWWITTETINQGSKQNKSRPWLIVSNDVCNDKSPVLTAVPLTTADKGNYPFHVAVNNFGTTNLILCEQITSIEKSQCERYMYSVSVEVMNKVNSAILLQLGIASVIEEDKLTEPKPRRNHKYCKYSDDEKKAIIADYDKHGGPYCMEKYDINPTSFYRTIVNWKKKNETATGK